MIHQLTKFQVLRVDMVINPPWNLPFPGAKGLTSPEQTATGVAARGGGGNTPAQVVVVVRQLHGVEVVVVAVVDRCGDGLWRYREAVMVDML
ncbi:hypothetical protein Tco_0586984 [Tanacetum coccineum]